MIVYICPLEPMVMVYKVLHYFCSLEWIFIHIFFYLQVFSFYGQEFGTHMQRNADLSHYIHLLLREMIMGRNPRQ